MSRIEEQLFTWKDLNEYVLDCLSLGYCTFIKDFGPWEKGHEADNMVFNFEESTLTEYSDEGKKLVTCNLELKAESWSYE